MSVFGDIIDAVKANIEAAVPSMTVIRGFIEPAMVSSSDLPHCQLFAPAQNVTGFLEARQEAREYGFTAMITTRDQTQEQLITLFEDIEDEFEDDRRLSDTVSWSHIGSMGIDEVPAAKTRHQTIAFEVIVELVV